MKIFLIILCILIVLLAGILFSKITFFIEYEDKFIFKIKFLGITIFDNCKEKSSKQKKVSTKSSNKKPSKNENFLKQTYKEKGLLGTVNYFFNILSLVFKKVKWLVKHIKFRKFDFNLSIATDDAAKTAIRYGEVCSVIYPIISLLQTQTNLKLENVDIKADFDNSNSMLKTSILAKVRLIICIIAVAVLLFEYLKLQNKESEKNERK